MKRRTKLITKLLEEAGIKFAVSPAVLKHDPDFIVLTPTVSAEVYKDFVSVHWQTSDSSDPYPGSFRSKSTSQFESPINGAIAAFHLIKSALEAR